MVPQLLLSPPQESIRNIQPKKRSTSVVVQTADHGLVHISAAVDVTIKANNSSTPPQQTELLIVDSLSDEVLGCDLVVGLPLLYSLGADINFETVPASVRWSTSGRQRTHNPPTESPNQNRIAETAKSYPQNNSRQHQTHTEVQNTHTHSYVYNNHPETMEDILETYSEVFADKLMGSTINLPAARVNLLHKTPIRAKMRNHSPQEALEIEQHIKQLFENSIIEHSDSEYSSNCRLVPEKKRQEETGQYLHRAKPGSRARHAPNAKCQRPPTIPARKEVL